MVSETFKKKAAAVKLIVTDVDGVWTDGRMYYTAGGEAMKGFSTYDGMGVQRAREAGLEVAVVTGEESPVVSARAAKLGIRRLALGEKDKASRVDSLCRELAIGLDQVAYIGDDVNDLETMRRVGLTALACNSPVLGLFTPDYVTRRPGGDGAFRDFVDRIIEARSGPAQ